MKISPARKSAFEILLRIKRDNAFSAILLPVYESSLDRRDGALCHELVMGTLRRQINLDRIIEKLSNKSVSKLDSEVVIALELGLYQLKYLDRVPDYSSINDSVNLVKAAKKKSAAGFVNAILRRASREEAVLEFSNDLDKLAVETSHPEWLLENWERQFGKKRMESIARANNMPSPLAFRFTKKFQQQSESEQTNMRSVLVTEGGAQKSILVPEGFVAPGFSDILRQLAEDGFIYFQDEASQLVALNVKLNHGESFLDLCSAPGSKFTQICSNRIGSGATVAGDLHHHRLKTLVSSCDNQSVESSGACQLDATKPLPFLSDSFDCILLDAPCSGTGTIRRNPEIRYSLEKNDIFALSDKQLSMLENASHGIKKGGRIIYSTCSLEQNENEGVINRFLTKRPDFEKVMPSISTRFITSEKYGRFFPDIDNTDGFFIAILTRRG